MNPLRALLATLPPALAVAVMVPGRSGLLLGLLLLFVIWPWLRSRAPRSVRRERQLAVSQLPITADLLAAALRAGAPPELAALIVGEELAGPMGRRLVRVARGLRVGLSPNEAWAVLKDIPGADRISRAAVRSAGSGAVLTTTLDRLAEDLRADRAARAEAAAQRIGVLVVLPLGLCFLPAFFLTGVVPVVAAVLGDVLHS